MSREIVISEAEKMAVILENGIVREFYLSEGEQYVGDIILATVESIVPAIEAAFLDIGRDKSGFIHVSDLPASRKQQSGIRQFLKSNQQMLVQVTREPTGNKGASLTGFIQLPGRFLVLTPFERRIGLSKRIYDARERARLSRIARMICGSGYGIVLRPEAVGQSEQTLREDLKLLLGRWKHILGQSEKQPAGTTLYRDQDILERILREGATSSVTRVVVDSQATYERAMKYFNNWSDTKAREKLRVYSGQSPILSHYGIFQQLEKAIQPMAQLPSGGTVVIQQTEALTSIDVNTSSMTSSDNQPETILRTNCEAAEEIARQLMLRDIGGVIVIDFIDMDNPRDQQIVWQKLSDALQPDKAQPQISYFSEFGLVEMTRRRQRQRLSEMLTMPCPACQGVGRIRNLLYRSDILTGEGMKVRLPVIQPEEKSSRYRGGVEKPTNGHGSPPVSAPVAPVAAPAAPASGGRGRGGHHAPAPTHQEAPAQRAPQSSGGGRGRGGHVAQPKVASAPPPAPLSHHYEEEVETKVHAQGRTPLDEKPEDLLFDDSLFTQLTQEVVESYIEREDALNVSGKLAGSLDTLVARIEADGIGSIKRIYDDRPSADGGDEGDYAETETPEFQPAAEDLPVAESEDVQMEDEEEAPPAPRSRRAAAPRGGTRRRRPEPEVDYEDLDEGVGVIAEVDAPAVSQAEPGNEADEAELSSAADHGEHADADDEDSSDEAGSESEFGNPSITSLAESALTASSTNSAVKPKRILTKRRTIRSFRPKR